MAYTVSRHYLRVMARRKERRLEAGRLTDDYPHYRVEKIQGGSRYRWRVRATN